MMRALSTSASGMRAQQIYVDTIANNLANVNTSGFKASRAEFQDLLYQVLSPNQSQSAGSGIQPIQVGHGVRLAAIRRIFTQTGRPIVSVWPVGFSAPVSGSIRKIASEALFWCAQRSHRPVGSIPKFRGVFPPHGAWPAGVSFPVAPSTAKIARLSCPRFEP